jgi:nucleotide-binding universal stress UspA family protein
MYSIKRILVTTDFSDYSAVALEFALSLADVHNADVHLLHVVDGGSRSSRRPEEIAHPAMQKFVFETVDEFQNITQAIRSGIPHVEILRYAQEYRIDMIVIATHGRTGLAHVLMGSVAEKVVRHAKAPVLTVKPDAILENLISDEDVAADLHIPHA